MCVCIFVAARLSNITHPLIFHSFYTFFHLPILFSKRFGKVSTHALLFHSSFGKDAHPLQKKVKIKYYKSSSFPAYRRVLSLACPLCLSLSRSSGDAAARKEHVLLVAVPMDIPCVKVCLLLCTFVCDVYVCDVCVCVCVCVCLYMYTCMHMYVHIYVHLVKRGGGLGSRPKKMYGERLGDGVEYHLMKPTPRR